LEVYEIALPSESQAGDVLTLARLSSVFPELMAGVIMQGALPVGPNYGWCHFPRLIPIDDAWTPVYKKWLRWALGAEVESSLVRKDAALLNLYGCTGRYASWIPHETRLAYMDLLKIQKPSELECKESNDPQVDLIMKEMTVKKEDLLKLPDPRSARCYHCENYILTDQWGDEDGDQYDD